MFTDFSNGVQTIRAGVLPPNLYGDATFLIKVQSSSDASGPLLLYDKARSVRFNVFKGSCPEGHAALSRKLQLEGGRGKLLANTAARKLYMRARREAANLRVFMGALPEQQQNW